MTTEEVTIHLRVLVDTEELEETDQSLGELLIREATAIWEWNRLIALPIVQERCEHDTR